MPEDGDRVSTRIWCRGERHELAVVYGSPDLQLCNHPVEEIDAMDVLLALSPDVYLRYQQSARCECHRVLVEWRNVRLRSFVAGSPKTLPSVLWDAAHRAVEKRRAAFFAQWRHKVSQCQKTEK